MDFHFILPCGAKLYEVLWQAEQPTDGGLPSYTKKLCLFFNVHIGLMQLGTRCSDGSCQAQEDLIAGFSAIETEAELVQIRLKLCTAAVICAEQKRFQVADSLVQPMQIAGLIFFRVQRNAGQIPIKADVTYCTVYGRYKTT